ncbi:hypothetical protein AALA21_06135 [Eggerthellaceae bacterium 3-80]|nr:hypothetical protein D7W09_05840 [bacterium D16-34]
MAKSQIIKDLANGKSSLKTSLKRAKVLMSGLNDKRALTWINNELVGYSSSDKLPDYRLKRGMLTGSYFKGSMATHMKWTAVSIPLGNMPEDTQNQLLTVQFLESVEALQLMLNAANQDGSSLGKQIPADFFPYIAQCNEDPYMMITAAQVKLNSSSIQQILDCVENKLLDTLLILEDAFGPLDELDISITETDIETSNKVVEQIVFNIYDDHSVIIGEKATIKDTTIE